MDPISLVGAIFGFVSALRSAQELYLSWREHVQKEEALDPSIEPDDLNGFMLLLWKFNRFVSFLGGKLREKLDINVLEQLEGLQPKLTSLRKTIALYSNGPNYAIAGSKDNIQRMMQQARLLREDVTHVLDGTTQKMGLDSLIKLREDETLPLSLRPRTFCQGAIRLQSSKADDEAIGRITLEASESPLGISWGVICKYCCLEIGNYRAVRFSKEVQPLNSETLLAASHLTSCRSLVDRRAFYKCLACYGERKEVDFPSAEAFEKHMEQHPGFIFTPTEKVDVRVKKEMEVFLLKEPPPAVHKNDIEVDMPRSGPAALPEPLPRNSFDRLDLSSLSGDQLNYGESRDPKDAVYVPYGKAHHFDQRATSAEAPVIPPQQHYRQQQSDIGDRSGMAFLQQEHAQKDMDPRSKDRFPPQQQQYRLQDTDSRRQYHEVPDDSARLKPSGYGQSDADSQKSLKKRSKFAEKMGFKN